jgi:hypothetical protein
MLYFADETVGAVLAADLPPTTKLVLLVVCLVSQPVGERAVLSFRGEHAVSVVRLAKICGLHRVTVQRILAKLKADGILVKHENGLAVAVKFEDWPQVEENLRFWATAKVKGLAEAEYGEKLLHRLRKMGERSI